jgi:hypothetical protein
LVAEKCTCGICVESAVWQNPSALKKGELSKILEKDVSNVTHEPLGAGQAGALSAMGRVNVEYSSPKANDISSFVVKCGPPGLGERLFTDGGRMFEKEILFYKIISGDIPLRVPKLHHSYLSTGCGNKTGVLLLEDLGQLEDPQFGQPFVPDEELITSMATADTVTKQLASMHAKFWETQRFKGDLSLFSTTGRGHNSGKSTVTQSQHFFFKGGWDKFVGLGVGMSANTEALGVALKAKFPALYQLNFDAAPSTFIHGDAGLYNIMFYEESEMCLFDWQMCQRGRGIFDLAFFLVLSTPIEFLKNNEAHFLELYHDELTRLGVTYPMVQLQEDYKVALVTSWAIIVYVTGLLASKGPEWLEKIKVAALRTVAAIERTGAVTATAEKLNIALVPSAPLAASIAERDLDFEGEEGTT